MASHRSGTNLYEIDEIYGERGLVKLENMIEGGLLYKSDDRVFAKNSNFSIDLELLGKHLPHLMEFYRPDKLNEGKNLCYLLSESLTLEGIQKIKSIQEEAAEKVYEVMKSPDFNGPHHFMSIFFLKP
jgi:hypothetical protein